MEHRQKIAALTGSSPGQVRAIREAFEADGMQAAWQVVLKRARERMAKGEHVSPGWLAFVAAQAGEIDEALALLEKAYQDRDAWMVYIKADPLFDPLRDDPRFQSLLRRMNFPER